MSRTDGHRGASGKRCPESKNGGCEYCKTGEYKKPLRRKARRDARADMDRMVRDATATPEHQEASSWIDPSFRF